MLDLRRLCLARWLASPYAAPNIDQLGRPARPRPVGWMLEYRRAYLSHKCSWTRQVHTADMTPTFPGPTLVIGRIGTRCGCRAGEAPTAMTPPFRPRPLAGSRPIDAFWASLDAYPRPSDVRGFSQISEPSLAATARSLNRLCNARCCRCFARVRR